MPLSDYSSFGQTAGATLGHSQRNRRPQIGHSDTRPSVVVTTSAAWPSPSGPVQRTTVPATTVTSRSTMAPSLAIAGGSALTWSNGGTSRPPRETKHTSQEGQELDRAEATPARSPRAARR